MLSFLSPGQPEGKSGVFGWKEGEGVVEKTRCRGGGRVKVYGTSGNKVGERVKRENKYLKFKAGTK